MDCKPHEPESTMITRQPRILMCQRCGYFSYEPTYVFVVIKVISNFRIGDRESLWSVFRIENDATRCAESLNRVSDYARYYVKKEELR
jgi:hypothetical protein